MAMFVACKGFQLANCTDSRFYPKLGVAFTQFMTSRMQVQRPSGMWTQLLDKPDTFECSSATTRFSRYSLVTGVKIGALVGAHFEIAIS